MLQIPCPWCGPRDEIEFSGGVLKPLRPDAGADDVEWTNYLYQRDNARGWSREHWVHNHGCAQWFLVVRNTATNVIASAHRLDEPTPELPQ